MLQPERKALLVNVHGKFLSFIIHHVGSGDCPVYLRVHAVSMHWKDNQNTRTGLAEADNVLSSREITKRDQDMVILILIGEGRESVIDTGQGGHWISPASLWRVLAVPMFDLDFVMDVGCCVMDVGCCVLYLVASHPAADDTTLDILSPTRLLGGKHKGEVKVTYISGIQFQMALAPPSLVLAKGY